MGFEHTSVMPKEVHEYQNMKPGDICVDCTLGGSGHALSTIRAILPNGTLLGIDQDIDAIANAKKVLHPFEKIYNCSIAIFPNFQKFWNHAVSPASIPSSLTWVFPSTSW